MTSDPTEPADDSYPSAWRPSYAPPPDEPVDPPEAEAWLAWLVPVELAQTLHRVRGDR